MATLEPRLPVTAIDPATEVGVVSLSVANLDRSIAYYSEAIGLTLLERNGADAVVGVPGTPLLLIREQPGALPWLVDGMTGLYHFAILVPTRADLGRWLDHYLTTGYPPPGQGDHIVSEAFYLRDPDGHGIEVYADRPRSTWSWVNGRVRMGTGPIDVRGLLSQSRAEGKPWSGMPAGTKVGHVHLQVGSIPAAEAFYHGVLGFDVVAQMPSALFVSAGGYHHHLGLNTWHSQNASPAPADVATLRYYTLALPSPEALTAVRDRLVAAGSAFQDGDRGLVVRDPWQNELRLHVGAAT